MVKQKKIPPETSSYPNNDFLARVYDNLHLGSKGTTHVWQGIALN